MRVPKGDKLPKDDSNSAAFLPYTYQLQPSSTGIEYTLTKTTPENEMRPQEFIFTHAADSDAGEGVVRIAVIYDEHGKDVGLFSLYFKDWLSDTPESILDIELRRWVSKAEVEAICQALRKTKDQWLDKLMSEDQPLVVKV